jgi:hypothetical protein
VSVEAVAAVLHHSRAKGTDKLVLIGIANHAGDGGAWPTIDTLGKYAACSRTRVKQAIARLVELGEVSVAVQGGGNSDTRADRRPNRYDVLVACPPECDRTYQHRTNGGHTGDSRDDERGSLFDPTGVTRVTPNRPLEPSITDTPNGVSVRDDAPTEGQRVNALAKRYTDHVPLSNFPAVAGVIRKAVRVGMWPDDVIGAALDRLADEGRSVTTDALRYELTGFPGRQSNRDRALAAGVESVRRYAATESAPTVWELTS